MEFRVLGPLEVVTEGAVLDVGTPRLRLLLAILLLRSGEAVSADRLIEDLWDANPPETGRHTLQGYVYRLRRALGSDGWRLETRPHGYQLKVSPDELDVRRFQDLVEQGREAFAGGQPETAAGLLQRALRLWRGPVLADLPDLLALEPERARLEGMRLAAAEDRLEADLAVGRHVAVVAELEGFVSEHPFRERPWGQLMVALYRAGRQAEALQAFRRAREVLGEELGIEPSPWLSRLQEQILIHDPGLGQPEATEPVRPAHDLPAERTSFVGRRQELADLAGLLATRRLITVTGPPGSGKTRLAIEAAARSVQDHPHGVCFVPLAEIDEPDLVPSAIADALSVAAPDRPILEAVIDHAKARRLLLVLDNFEHLLPGASLVGRLLDAAPGLRILATSRAPLRLSGEQEYGVSPLPLPEAGALESAEEPSRFDSLALFADRARAIDPHFTLTVDNASLVAEVTARVDGLPLAIELAAARLRLFPLTELRRRLETVLPLLTEGPKDRPARQRKLRNAIAWSYDLLGPGEQALFRRLGIFRGGFTLEAAQSVASSTPVEDVVAGVSALVEVSLLRRPAEAGPVRYSMLETIREYALEQLRAADEEEQIARRHADFYAALVEQAEPELTRANQAEWLTRLAAEHANLSAVLRWAKRTEHTDMGLLIAGRMWRFWQLRGHFTEGRLWLEDLLALEGEAPTVPRVKALLGLAGLCYWQGDLDGAETGYREAVAVFEDLDDWWLEFEALGGLVATIACHRGKPEEAAPLEEQFQALVAGRQDPFAIGFAMATSALVRLFLGDLEGARQYNEQVLAGTRALGERWYEGQTLRALALTALLQERYEQAEEEFQGSLDIALEAGDMAGMAYDLDRLGQAAVTLGQPKRAVILAGAASRLREAVGGGLTVQHFRWETEHPRDAARRVLTEPEIDIAWAQGRSMNPDDAVAYARESAQNASHPQPDPA
jgi:predicted ATPase/DNA-binding SARP family transcriptional activator